MLENNDLTPVTDPELGPRWGRRSFLEKGGPDIFEGGGALIWIISLFGKKWTWTFGDFPYVRPTPRPRRGYGSVIRWRVTRFFDLLYVYNIFEVTEWVAFAFKIVSMPQ